MILLGLASCKLLTKFLFHWCFLFHSLFPFCQSASLFTFVCIKTKIISSCWKTSADVTTPWRKSWTLPTVCLLPAFITLCFPSLTEIVLQHRDPFHYVFSPSVVLDKTKWWTKSGQSLSYTDTWHQDVLIKTRLYLPRAVTSMYCFLKSRIFFMQQNIHRLGIIQRSNCRRHRDKLKYKLAGTPGVPGVSTRIPKINTTSLKTAVFWHLYFSTGCWVRQTKGILGMLAPA